MHICIVNLHFTLALQRKKYSGGKADMTIMDAIFMLNNLIDESDPDVSTVDIGNIICAILY
jgi:hypothetical protein